MVTIVTKFVMVTKVKKNVHLSRMLKVGVNGAKNTFLWAPA